MSNPYEDSNGKLKPGAPLSKWHTTRSCAQAFEREEQKKKDALAKLNARNREKAAEEKARKESLDKQLFGDKKKK